MKTIVITNKDEFYLIHKGIDGAILLIEQYDTLSELHQKKDFTKIFPRPFPLIFSSEKDKPFVYYDGNVRKESHGEIISLKEILF